MLFLTYWFVVFLCITLPVYWLVRWPRFRLALLCLSCAVFHTHFAGPAGVAPIVVLGVVTYLAGLSRNRTACSAGSPSAALKNTAFARCKSARTFCPPITAIRAT